MEGGPYLGDNIAVLDRLNARQRVVMETLGARDLAGELLIGPDIWARMSEIVERDHDIETVQDLLESFQHTDSLRTFVLLELRAMGDEIEQATALLTAARTLWQLNHVRQPHTTREEEFAPPSGGRRYTGVTQWEGDVWSAFDTHSSRQAYVRSEGRPSDTAAWTHRPPRFQGLGQYGTHHWCGYDIATARWMFIAHAQATPPAENAPGWTDARPATAGQTVVPTEDPELDEAVQSLANAVRSGAIALDELSAPLRHVAGWAKLSLGELSIVAGEVNEALRTASGHQDKNAAYRPIARLRSEMERLASRCAALERWPADWSLGGDAGPDRFARMLRLGSQGLRRAVRLIAKQDSDITEVVANGSGRSTEVVQNTLMFLTNFAWAMGRERCASEMFADPLHNFDRMAGLASLMEACPDLALGVRNIGYAVLQFRDGQCNGAQYENALRGAQKVLRRYSEGLFRLEGRWPGWGDGEEALPEESPTAYAAMIRLGWQMLEAERRELRTFVDWERRPREVNMPLPKSPGNRRLSAVRAAIPRRDKPLPPLALLDLATLRALAHAMAEEDWAPSVFAHPLTGVDVWRASPVLRGGYPEFREGAAGVARLYASREVDGEAYKDAVARLIAVLEAVRMTLGLLGTDWPVEWRREKDEHPVPAQSPAALRYLIDDGKRELRASTRNLSSDLRAAAPEVRAKPASSRNASTLPSARRRKPRRRSGSAVGSVVRRFFFGSNRHR
ncbi:hypothetical protein ACFCXT_30440 [Streptomyces vinaceus]|uniref:hypothetical protein n=1 Tax=Streptomyces vinaceus TaxID=1960 RepID=UPI0035DA4273